MKTTFFLILLVILTFSSQSYAKCNFNNPHKINLLANSFDAIKAEATAMKECGNFKSELNSDFQKKINEAIKANPALYEIVMVTNSGAVSLLADGTIRELNDLIKKYGKNISPNRLISYEGKIMAIASRINNQHFMYRNDIFKKLNIPEPKTYQDVLNAAEKIKKSKLVEYPYGAAFKSGWNLGNEFINIYLGFKGEFFDKKNNPTLDNKVAIKTLELMKKLTKYMDPEYLVSDSTYVQKQFQQGKIAMSNLWATRAAAMNDAKESQVVDLVSMSSAPLSKEGGLPASANWWGGYAISKNIPDDVAESAFQVLLEGTDTEMVKANNDLSIWLIKGYQQNELSKGVVDTINNGSVSFPASKSLGLMHTALGNGVPDFLTGRKDAKTTLKDISEAYIIAAKEKGFIQ